MGQSSSKKADRGFYLKHTFSDNDRQVFNLLGLKEEDMEALHKAYLKVVAIKRVAVTNSKGAAAGMMMDLEKDVRVGHLLVWADEERSVFSSTIFSIFSRKGGRSAKGPDADDESGAHINFSQFVVSMWNYLSIPVAALPTFVFNLYDQDSSGGLDKRELVVLLTHLYGADFMKDQQVANLFRILEGNIRSDDRHETTMDLPDFVQFCHNHPTLLTGAGKFQLHLVKATLGQRGWDRLAAARLKLSDGTFKSTHAILASNGLDFSHLGLVESKGPAPRATPSASAAPAAAAATTGATTTSTTTAAARGGPRRKSDAGIPNSQALLHSKTASIAKAAAAATPDGGPRGHILTKHKKDIVVDQKISIADARALLTGEKPREKDKEKAGGGLLSFVFGGGAAQPTPLPGANAPPVTVPPHKPLERKESLMMAQPAVTFKQQPSGGGQKLRRRTRWRRSGPFGGPSPRATSTRSAPRRARPRRPPTCDLLLISAAPSRV